MPGPSTGHVNIIDVNITFNEIPQAMGKAYGPTKPTH
jgi:hypothetical protein